MQCRDIAAGAVVTVLRNGAASIGLELLLKPGTIEHG